MCCIDWGQRLKPDDDDDDDLEIDFGDRSNLALDLLIQKPTTPHDLRDRAIAELRRRLKKQRGKALQ